MLNLRTRSPTIITDNRLSAKRHYILHLQSCQAKDRLRWLLPDSPSLLTQELFSRTIESSRLQTTHQHQHQDKCEPCTDYLRTSLWRQSLGNTSQTSPSPRRLRYAMPAPLATYLMATFHHNLLYTR